MHIRLALNDPSKETRAVREFLDKCAREVAAELAFAGTTAARRQQLEAAVASGLTITREAD